MRSDDVAAQIVSVGWARDGADFIGTVQIGDTELRRFVISKGDYIHDRCAPCESQARKLRDEIAKILRREYEE